MSTQTNCTTCQKEIHEGMTCQEYSQYLQFIQVLGSKERAEIFKIALKMIKENSDPLTKDCFIQFNTNILKNEVVLTKFVNAFQHVKFENVEDGIFGWHGSSNESVQNIMKVGFDPMQRGEHVGQAYGKGEYFNSTSQISSGYLKNNGNHLILAFIIKGNHLSIHANDIFVVNNPVDRSYTYCLPLFIVSYRKHEPVNYL